MVYEEGNVNLRSHAITVGSRSHRPLKLPTDLLTRRDPSTQLPITAGSDLGSKHLAGRSLGIRGQVPHKCPTLFSFSGQQCTPTPVCRALGRLAEMMNLACWAHRRL